MFLMKIYFLKLFIKNFSTKLTKNPINWNIQLLHLCNFKYSRNPQNIITVPNNRYSTDIHL